MSDEGLHEIQLNGKQLVFLFMTATVVAVVIFLCGVMVGRGVPVQRGAPVLAADGVDPTRSDSAAASSDIPATSTTASGPSASPSSNLGLTYPDRLEEPEPVVEELSASPPSREAFAATAVAKVPPAKAEPVAKSATKPASVATAPAESTVPAASAKALPASASGPGFVVQVTASRQRAEADTIKARLVRKGYPAFVTTAGSSAAPTYRVRVGTYPSKRDADTVAAKLEREEQFKPWVTR
jgi:cell division septation protein DedD